MFVFTLAISCLTTSNLSWFIDQLSRFLCSIALYSIGLYFHHQSHPQLGDGFALAPSLHSLWSSFSTDLQYDIGEQWRNNSRKNEKTEPKKKQHPVVDVTGGGSKVQCYKEHYCIEPWNVRSMNQGKLEVVKQEVAGVNIDILWINELKWTGRGTFIQMTIISTTVGNNPSEEMELPS